MFNTELGSFDSVAALWDLELGGTGSHGSFWLNPAFVSVFHCIGVRSPSRPISCGHPVRPIGSFTSSLRLGSLFSDDTNVMSYLRSYKGKAVLVALNMSASPSKATFNLADKGFASANLKSLVATPQSSAKGMEVTLEPFGVFIAEVSK